MARHRPILGLLVSPEPPAALVRLLYEMRMWCEPRAAEPDLAAAAWLATSLDASGVGIAAGSGKRWAVWVDDAAGLRRAETLGPELILTSRPSVAERSSAILISDEVQAPADRLPVIPPFVRERMRQRAGLPAVLVADIASNAVPDTLMPAALATCSACVVTGSRLGEALAWGAPAVTDAVSAAGAGARHDQEVLVAPESERAQLAEALARDPLRAARLSRAARRLAEAQSVKRVAAQVVERLGLLRATEASVDARVEAMLRVLSVPESPLEPDVARRLNALESRRMARAEAAGPA